VENNGPRKAMSVSAVFWASGFLVGALGIATKQLWLVYLGYGWLVVSWVLVAVLLGYGIVQTAVTAAKLFTG
jgi:hypothetical protein